MSEFSINQDFLKWPGVVAAAAAVTKIRYAFEASVKYAAMKSERLFAISVM